MLSSKVGILLLLFIQLTIFFKFTSSTTADGYEQQVCLSTPATNANQTGPGETKTIPCPSGLQLTWDIAPPLNVKEGVTFSASYQLMLNVSEEYKPNITLGRGYLYPHANLHACPVDIFCDPTLTSENHTLIQLTRDVKSNTPYWTSELALPPGKWSVIAHIFYYDDQDVQYDVSIGRVVDSIEEKSEIPDWVWAVLGVGVFLVLVGGILLYLVFRKNKSVNKKIKKYPKNMPKPSDSPATLQAIKDLDGPISRNQFVLLEEVGSGQFGAVYRGALFHGGKAAVCAIKTLKEPNIANRKEFLDEAEIMKSLQHKNIVNFLGISEEEEGEPLCLLLEFLPMGDLKKYLMDLTMTDEHFGLTEKLFHCMNIASGMAYLASENIVHRDLAARNVMIEQDKAGNSLGHPICKIADFGLARVKSDEEYYVMESKGPLPVRWMALEAMTERKYTEKSDVWSYGVTVYEVFTRGAVPYSDVQTFNIVASIASGTRLSKPPKIPEDIWQFVQTCFLTDYDARPNFAEIEYFMKTKYEKEALPYVKAYEMNEIENRANVFNDQNALQCSTELVNQEGYVDFNKNNIVETNIMELEVDSKTKLKPKKSTRNQNDISLEMDQDGYIEY